jgi:hypothetical protein
MRRLTILIVVATFLAAPSLAAAAPPDLAAARGSLSGRWVGQLEYLDYSANQWFGIPVTTSIEDQGDGATMIRKSDFDDGPKVGMVRITTVELFDAAKSSVATGTFRKGRTAEIVTYTARLASTSIDATHWTMIEETRSLDDSRPATLRLTTVRDGDTLQTLKEVDFLDDQKSEWLKRNRTTLRLQR